LASHPITAARGAEVNRGVWVTAFSNQLADEMLQLLFAPVPNAEPLVGAAKRAIAGVFDATFKVLKLDEPGSLEWASTLFAWSHASPAANLLLASEFAAQSEPSALALRARALAQRVAETLGPVFAQSFWGDATPEASKPGPDEATPSADRVDNDFAALAKDKVFAPIRDALKESGLLDLAKGALSGGGVFAAAGTYHPEKVKAALRALARILQRYAPALKQIAVYVESEIGQAIFRSAIAEAIGRALEEFSVKSSAPIGIYVHGMLQDRYRAHYRMRRLVIERFNSTTRRAELVVYHPSLSNDALALQFVAGSRQYDPDYFFATLRAAMNGFHLYSQNSWLRADLVDADAGQIWEIKPTSSLFGGVWQELLYRVTHNIVRMLFLATIPPSLRRGGFLQPGTFWSLEGDLVSESRVRGFLLLEPIHLRELVDAPAIAFPFQLGVLPGLIGYFVLRGPNIPQLSRVIETIIVAAMTKALREMLRAIDKLESGWGEAVEAARKVYAQISPILAKIADAIVTLVLIIACIAAAIALGFVIIKVAALIAAALAGVGAIGGAAAAAALIILFIASPKNATPSSRGGARAKIDPFTELQIGCVRVQGIPIARAPELLAAIGSKFDEITRSFLSEMSAGSPGVA
jgi:hypothetical protein